MSPGRGWVPQRRFRLFRCLKLAPAERCGHVTERRQSAPACLRVPAPNARRAEERRLRPAGRAGKAAPGLEGAAGGTRGRAGGVQQPAPPRIALPPWSTSFRDSGRHSPRLATHSAAAGSPSRLSPRGCVGSGLGFCPQACGYVPSPRPAPVGGRLLPGPSPEVSRRSFIPFPRRTLGKRGRHSGRPGRPSPGLSV